MAEPERWKEVERDIVAGPGPELVNMPTALPPASEAERREFQRRQWEQRGENFGRMIASYRRQAWRLISAARLRARETGDLYPLQTIAAVAGVAFLLGIVSRVGRNVLRVGRNRGE